MADVNVVEILIKARDQAKPDLVALQARLDALAHEVATARAEVNDAGAAAKLDALDAKLLALSKRVANPKIDMAGAVRAEAQIHAVEKALSDLNGKTADAEVKTSGLAGMLMRLGGAAGGAAGVLGGGSGGLSGVLGGISPLAAGAAAAVAALATGFGGILSGAVAASMGLASFGALAIPTLQKLMTNFSALQGAIINYGDASANLDTAIHRSAANWTAYQATIHGIEPDFRSAAGLLTNQNVLWQNLAPAMQANVIALSNNKTAMRLLLPDQKAALTALLAQADAWGNLTPAQQTGARSLQSLQGEFHKLVAAMAPLTFKVLNDGLKIANTLLPQLLPFAQAAGTAIDGLLKQFEKFAQSPGFQQWKDQMLKLSGPWITAIGDGIGKIAIAVGKFLIAVSNPQAIHEFTGLINTLAAALIGLGNLFHKTTALMISQGNNWASSFKKNVSDSKSGWASMSQASAQGANTQKSAWDLDSPGRCPGLGRPAQGVEHHRGRWHHRLQGRPRGDGERREALRQHGRPDHQRAQSASGPAVPHGPDGGPGPDQRP